MPLTEELKKRINEEVRAQLQYFVKNELAGRVFEDSDPPLLWSVENDDPNEQDVDEVLEAIREAIDKIDEQTDER